MQKKGPVGETRRKLGEAQGWPSVRLKHLGYVGGCLPFLSLCPHVRHGPPSTHQEGGGGEIKTSPSDESEKEQKGRCR